MDSTIRLCKYLLEKYADIINERERRTIGEIKTLVDGTDLSIQSLVSDFKDPAYSFESDYKKALEQVFEYIKKEIDFVEMDINLNYWLEPREILEAKAADDEDLAVFLCGCLKALGDSKAEVIIAEMTNLKTHAFVATEIEKEFFILDATQNHNFSEYSGTKLEVLKKYSFEKQKIKRFLYRFNSEKYEQFLE